MIGICVSTTIIDFENKAFRFRIFEFYTSYTRAGYSLFYIDFNKSRFNITILFIFKFTYNKPNKYTKFHKTENAKTNKSTTTKTP